MSFGAVNVAMVHYLALFTLTQGCDPQNCINSTCHLEQAIPYCTYGCKSGFAGNLCKEICRSTCFSCERDNLERCTQCFQGHYGNRCENQCGNCLNQNCAMNGSCTDGCDPSQRGRTCDEGCAPGCPVGCDVSLGNCSEETTEGYISTTITTESYTSTTIVEYSSTTEKTECDPCTTDRHTEENTSQDANESALPWILCICFSLALGVVIGLSLFLKYRKNNTCNQDDEQTTGQDKNPYDQTWSNEDEDSMNVYERIQASAGYLSPVTAGHDNPYVEYGTQGSVDYLTPTRTDDVDETEDYVRPQSCSYFQPLTFCDGSNTVENEYTGIQPSTVTSAVKY